MLYALDQLVEAKSDHAQYDDCGDNHIQLKDLSPIDDQITQPPSGRQKFPDDDADQGQTDVYLSGADEDREGGGKDHSQEGISSGSDQSGEEHQFVTVHLAKCGVEADDGSEDCHRDAGYDDRFHPGAQPDDKERGQCGLWQTV